MKKLTSLLAIAALISAITASSFVFAASAPKNILGDQGDPANITPSNDQSLTNEWWYWIQDTMVIPDDASYTIVEGVKADGTKGKLYQAAHPTPCTGNTRIVVTADKLKPNTKYRFSAMVKVDKDVNWSSTGQGSWIASDVKGATKVTPLGLQDKDTWKLLKTDFTTPEKVVDVTLYWAFEATGGTTWAYDFKLFEWDESMNSSAAPPSSSPPASSNGGTSSAKPLSSAPKTSSTASSSNTSNGGTNTGLIIGIVAAAVVVVGGGGAAAVLVYLKKKKNKGD